MNSIKSLIIQERGIGHDVELRLHDNVSPEAKNKIHGLIEALIDMVNEISNSKTENKEIH